MCFGNRSHRCFNRWHHRSAPVKKHLKVDNMKVDMVADMKVDMEVDLVVGKVVNRVAHMAADMDFSIICMIFRIGTFMSRSG